MHDVATRAGVSHQTVSRVLNGFAGVRPETKADVLAAIEELGYRRNSAARTLVLGRSQAIGVLVPNTPNFGPTASLYAVERAIRGAGFQPFVTVTPEDTESVTGALDFLFDHAIEALVVMAAVRDVLDVIDSYGVTVPVAYLLTGDERAPWSVSVNQEEGVALGVEHLVSRGHQRIQHIAGPSTSTEAELRVAAIAVELERHGLESLPTLFGDWTPKSGYDLACRLDPSTTAVFCGNDQMAMGLIHALVDAGLRVPADMSVIGFDDIPESGFILPPLTTVKQDFAAVGELAVELLVAALSGQELPNTTPLPAELIVRASVAAPRKS
ncbi:MAG: LacI family transcriptional regulator [Demequinaceae bacterium]|nr:LacI family transcriptional regulator [Demequinaceae bacterium]